MIQSRGMNTSLPQLGPTMKGMPRALCREPMVMPGVLVGISARVMPAPPCGEQVVRVVQLERQPQQGGHRAQGDVALLPVEADAR